VAFVNTSPATDDALRVEIDLTKEDYYRFGLLRNRDDPTARFRKTFGFIVAVA
jgi:hypothetical protein